MEALARKILTKPVEVLLHVLTNIVLFLILYFLWTKQYFVFRQVQVGGRSVVCSDVEQHVVRKKKPNILNTSLRYIANITLSGEEKRVC